MNLEWNSEAEKEEIGVKRTLWILVSFKNIYLCKVIMKEVHEDYLLLPGMSLFKKCNVLVYNCKNIRDFVDN